MIITVFLYVPVELYGLQQHILTFNILPDMFHSNWRKRYLTMISNGVIDRDLISTL